jgi:hypothetical protein
MRGPVPPIRIYIHGVLHRLGEIAGNHFNEPYRGTEGCGALVIQKGDTCASLKALCESSRVSRLCVFVGGLLIV